MSRGMDFCRRCNDAQSSSRTLEKEDWSNENRSSTLPAQTKLPRETFHVSRRLRRYLEETHPSHKLTPRTH